MISASRRFSLAVGTCGHLRTASLEHLAEHAVVVVVGLYREALDKEALGCGLVEVQCPDLEGARPRRYTLEQELVMAGVLVAKEVDLPTRPRSGNASCGRVGWRA